MTNLDVANEIFAITDVLSGQHQLRRALSDPSAAPERRSELARRLFGSKVGADALAALEGVVAGSWSSTEKFVRAVEREGITRALATARDEGSLDRVTDELHVLGRAVSESTEATRTLRSTGFDVEAKRRLVAQILGGRAHEVTELLAGRAVDGHRRNFSKTVDDYVEIAADIGDVVVAQVTVAQPLDDARLERLRNALSARVGRPVTLQVDVDPSVIGGINVAIGHDVYESTVAGRLEEVRRQLINS